MSGFVCSKCNTETHIFKSKSGGGEGLAKHFNIPFLGRIPLDPKIMKCCEHGKCFVKEYPDSICSKNMINIVDSLKKTVLKSDE